MLSNGHSVSKPVLLGSRPGQLLFFVLSNVGQAGAAGSQGDLLSGGVVTELPGAWKMKPGLCQSPEHTWHPGLLMGKPRFPHQLGVSQPELLVAIVPTKRARARTDAQITA